MSKFPSIIAVVLAGQTLLGCVSPRWAPPVVPNAPTAACSTTSTASMATPNQPDPHKMQDVMAELRELGALDPAAQDKLLADLRESDPSLWPLVMQQFRATAAYRQRAMDRAGVAQRDGTTAGLAERLPPVTDVAVARVETPPANYPQTSAPTMETPTPANQTPSRVMQASYVAPAVMGWRQRLAGTIEAMENEIPKNPSTPDEVAEHARLRMLYTAAGRGADAVRPIPGTSPSTQEFLAKELEGLTLWLDAVQTPDAARRAGEAKPALVAALAKLAESAPLVVRNMAFCTEVQSYGCAKRFDKYEFQPNQETLLYAEVENFASEPTAQGYHTALKSSYQILDAHGERVAEHTFAATEEHCQNLRRDFFIGYHLRLPKGIGPGKYTLRLVIEDMKCQKVGQASIEFEVTEKEEGGKRKGESKAGDKSLAER